MLPDVTQNFDCVFWCGDLNFRLSQPREEVVNWVEQQQFPLPSPYKTEMDQLTNSIMQGELDNISLYFTCIARHYINFILWSIGMVFRGFEEGPITFKPTYKYDPGTQMFDTSQKQRTPSYTDRILYKVNINIHEKLTFLRVILGSKQYKPQYFPVSSSSTTC